MGRWARGNFSLNGICPVYLYFTWGNGTTACSNAVKVPLRIADFHCAVSSDVLGGTMVQAIGAAPLVDGTKYGMHIKLKTYYRKNLFNNEDACTQKVFYLAFSMLDKLIPYMITTVCVDQLFKDSPLWMSGLPFLLQLEIWF